MNYMSTNLLQNKSTVFVPTMGALHNGHLELIRMAKDQADVVICSIFVNPLQFNRQEDFDNYPDRMESDFEMLSELNCDVVFTPNKEDLYHGYEAQEFNYGKVGEVLEGQYRPGHFNGMLNVIYRFFELINPDYAIFGEKDYQQIALVRWMTKKFNFKTKILEAKTVREESGLALSSRNLRLSAEDKKIASKIIFCLKYCKENKSKYSPNELKTYCVEYLSKAMRVDYFDIVDEISMNSIKSWDETDFPRALTAAYISGVRLIDNLALK